MSRRSAPLQMPRCPVSLLGQRRRQRSWPAHPGREGSAGRRLPGRFLPLARESVSLQPSPGRARSSSPQLPQTPRLSGRRGQGPGLARGSAVAGSRALLTWQLRDSGEGQRVVRVRAGGWCRGGWGVLGLGASPLLFKFHSLQGFKLAALRPRDTETGCVCLPDPLPKEIVVSVANVEHLGNFTKNSRVSSSLGKGRAYSHTE